MGEKNIIFTEIYSFEKKTGHFGPPPCPKGIKTNIIFTEIYSFEKNMGHFDPTPCPKGIKTNILFTEIYSFEKDGALWPTPVPKRVKNEYNIYGDIFILKRWVTLARPRAQKG